MLVTKLFVHFREPNRRIATLEKRNVIAATSISIAPVDEHHFKLRHEVVADLFYEARQLSRGGVVLSANTSPRCRFRFRFV